LGAERLFDQGIGDVFCGRTAGNYVDPAMLGGLEFTHAVAGSKLIVVLGHTQCGAVKAACNHATGGNLDALVANLRPAVRAVSGEADPDVRRGGDAKFVQRVAEAHVRLTVSGLGERSETLKRLLETGRIGVAGGIYDLATGKIAWLAGAAVNVKPAAAAPAAAAE
jgi:carbonic anhydrase